jgi:hypothetical protein
MCDGCPRSFHLPCLGLAAAPRGEWLCVFCVSAREGGGAAAAAAAARRGPEQRQPAARPRRRAIVDDSE